MKVTVVGTGYVGLVTGTCLADMGNEVVCHDVDGAKIDQLDRGEMPIFEPGLAELVRRNVREQRLRFTTDMAGAMQGCEICFIAVGTPPGEDGSADRRYVHDAAAAAADHMQAPLVLVVKSTVPVGTCDQLRHLVAERLQARGVDHRFEVVSNPEFLKEGKALDDFSRPDRIVVGADGAWGLEMMRSLYAPFLRSGHAFIEMDVRSSEMTKYASNVMLATRISLMNELAQVCEKVGADIRDVRRGVGSDSRIGSAFLYAGIGYGGSCFPKDVQALSRLAVDSDCPADILEAVERVNRHQKVLLANRAISHFGGNVRGRRFALWGLAFKPNTDDIREAPAFAIIRRLTEAGAEVSAYDPEAMENAKKHLAGNSRVSFRPGVYDVLEGADALILATEWPVFRTPDFERVKSLLKEPVIFDGRNQYDPQAMQEQGIQYFCIGRSSP